MNDYYQLRIDFSPCSEDITDLAAALLCDIGYESFVPDPEGVTAYIKAEDFDQNQVDDLIADFPFDVKSECSKTFIKGQDWNAEWEKHYFRPIIIGNRCVIHSSFHTDIPDAEFDIVIDPKMAFGTGHHATTSLIIEQLLDLDLCRKAVIDMGTGTGILAILASMRGADPVTAIEIDPCAYDNAKINTVTNGQPQITVINGDASALADIGAADIFIANINRNIIVGDIAEYAKKLNPGGIMLLSGFYEHDIPVVMDAASPLGLSQVSHTVKGDNWTCLKLVKES